MTFKTMSKWGTGALISLSMLSPPTTHAAERVLILGDSIMQAVSRSLERHLSRRDGFGTTSFTHIGTGLARLDLFDWHQRIEEQVEAHQPATVIIMMGANDNQPLRTPDGIVRLENADWERAYADRAGTAMDIMIQNGVSEVHWIELPDMRDEALQRDVTLINRLVEAEAAKRSQVTFQEIRSLLSRSPGTFSPYIIQDNGMPLDIRAGDGIHLNRRGADLLAEHLIDRIWGE